MIVFKVYHETLGGHVHIRLFAGEINSALSLAGNFVLRVNEFKAFKEVFKQTSLVEYIEVEKSK